MVMALVLLVQGALSAYTDTCMTMGMSSAEMSATDTMSHDMSGHEGHDMAEVSVGDGEADERGHGHICPPSGCDICEGENCSQCSPFQFSAITQQVSVIIKNSRPALPKLQGAASFVVSLRHWSQPPGRAPPLFL